MAQWIRYPQHFHCSGLCCCCGAGPIPGPRTSICLRCSQKKKKNSTSWKNVIGPVWVMDSSLDRLGQGSLFDGTTSLYGMGESSSKENKNAVIKKREGRISIVAQWVKHLALSLEGAGSLASLSGLRIQHCRKL